MDWFWITGQVLGFISMGLGWWASNQRNDKRLCQGNLATAALTAGHFLLIGSPLGAINQGLSAARFGFAHSRWATNQTIMALLCVAALLQGLWLAQSWADGWAVAGAIIATLALFRCRGNELRLGLLVSNLCNLMFSLHLVSLSGVLYQTVTIALLGRQLFGGTAPARES